jgi:hypothetical protein
MVTIKGDEIRQKVVRQPRLVTCISSLLSDNAGSNRRARRMEAILIKA